MVLAHAGPFVNINCLVSCINVYIFPPVGASYINMSFWLTMTFFLDCRTHFYKKEGDRYVFMVLVDVNAHGNMFARIKFN